MLTFLKKLYYTFFYFILTFQLYAQSNTLVFHQLSIKDGLSEATVRAITEDKKGFMWFGTENGLNKYDGYNFSIYLNNPSDPYSISSNNIKCLFTDSKGNLWIGTRYGLNLYNPLKNHFYNYHSDTLSAFKSIDGDIESIVEDSKGTIWISVSNIGLYKLESKNKKPHLFQFINNKIENGFTNLCIDTKDNLWIGTRDGLLYFDTHNNSFIDLRNKFGNGYQVRGLHLDTKNILWLATTNGFKKINTTNGVLSEFYHNSKNEYSIKGNNTTNIIPFEENILIGIDGSGLDEYNTTTNHFTHHTVENGSAISSNNINSIFKDSKGTLWVGTFLNGINFSNTITNFLVSVNNNPGSRTQISNGIVTSFLKDHNNNFWVTTDGGGIFVKENGAKVYTNYTVDDVNPIIKSNAVISLMEDKSGTIWFATYNGGLTAYKSRTNFTIYHHNKNDSTSLLWDKVKSMCEYNNEIWISTYGMGVSVFNKSTKKFRSYRNNPDNLNSIPSNWVNVFIKDSKNTLWLGTNNGICEFVPKTNSFKHYLFENTNSSDINHVFDIIEDKQSNFWIATHAGGLVLFDRTTYKSNQYIITDGLSDNSVKSIVEDNIGNLWLTSKNRITKFNINTLTSTPYTIEDGLPSKSFFPKSKYKDPLGKIYFGTNNGYLIIDPTLSNIKIEFPKVILTDFRIFNVQVNPNLKNSPLPISITEAKEVHLTYDQNTVSFSFAALNFIIPKQNHYAFILEGFDKDWNYTEQDRIAKYTNLDPGTYIFKVKASNHTDVWDDTLTTQFKVVITPPYWNTWWFKLLASLCIIFVIIFIISLRIRSIKNRNQWLNKLVIERTKELENTNTVLNEQKNKVELQSSQILSQQNELIEKKKILEKNIEKLAESNALHKRLISIIGHDIRGPLNQFALLFKYMDSDSSEWALEKMKEMSTSISMLATNLLDWATLNEDDEKLQPTNFHWQTVVDKALKELETSYSIKNIKLNISLLEEEVITGVAPLVLSAIRNILSNSIRFSNESGKIEIESDSTIAGFSRLRITDYGEGLDVNEVNKMIQGAAFKGMKESSLTTGAGLGMAICNDMLKKTGGRIEAALIPNTGATFYIYLPVKN